LSGVPKRYHRISPLRTELLPAFAFPGQGVVLGRELVWAFGSRTICSRIVRRSRLECQLRQPNAFIVGQLQNEWPDIARRKLAAHGYSLAQLRRETKVWGVPPLAFSTLPGQFGTYGDFPDAGNLPPSQFRRRYSRIRNAVAGRSLHALRRTAYSGRVVGSGSTFRRTPFAEGICATHARTAHGERALLPGLPRRCSTAGRTGSSRRWQVKRSASLATRGSAFTVMLAR
jgi:hypothetical protein